MRTVVLRCEMRTPEYLKDLTLENLQAICPEARELEYVLADDHSGDPAVYFCIKVDDSTPSERLINDYDYIKDWIFEMVWVGGEMDRYPYTKIRRINEVLV